MVALHKVGGIEGLSEEDKVGSREGDGVCVDIDSVGVEVGYPDKDASKVKLVSEEALGHAVLNTVGVNDGHWEDVKVAIGEGEVVCVGDDDSVGVRVEHPDEETDDVRVTGEDSLGVPERHLDGEEERLDKELMEDRMLGVWVELGGTDTVIVADREEHPDTDEVEEIETLEELEETRESEAAGVEL